VIDWAIATLPMERGDEFRRKLAEFGAPPDTSIMGDEIKYATDV
jgi:hypothetical protein